MAVNDSRSMNADFHQGVLDRSYVQLTPDRGSVEHPPTERMSWPQYHAAEQHIDHSHVEGLISHSARPKEIPVRFGAGDPRY
jgi:hypothetical protein